MRDILVVCPQQRDLRLIRAAGLERRFRVRYVGSDLDAEGAPSPADVLAEAAALPADGVVGTKDRSALLAAIVAAQRGLPGPTPAALLACQHKLLSRRLQLEVVPEAVPAFAPVGPAPPPFPPPWFVKPVVGRLSQDARRVDDEASLPREDATDAYSSAYAELASVAGLSDAGMRGYVVEELRRGLQVTLEGFSHRGRVTVVGVTDSHFYGETTSFERFEYPTALPSARRGGLAVVVERLLPVLGFDGGFFNAEFLVPASGPPTLIEVNGRIASQFAPLVHLLHGRSTYEALFELACGRDPQWLAREPERVAVSHVVRTFEDAYVAAVPEQTDDVEVLVRPGRNLSEQGANDAQSYRLAILYAAGADRDEAVAAARTRAAELRFSLERPRTPAAALARS
jgi:hypothetical protein